MRAGENDIREPGGRSPLSRRAMWLLLAAALGIYAYLTAANEGDAHGWVIFADTCELLAACVACVACAIRALREPAVRRAGADLAAPSNRRAWTFLAGAMGAWAIGQAATNVYEVILAVHVPEPSIADAFFLASYALLITGVLLFMQTPAGHLSHARAVVKGLLIATGLLLASWSLLVAPTLQSGSLDVGGLVNLSYPLLDALTLGAVAFTALRTRVRQPAGLGLLATGIVCFTIADSLWWYINEVSANAPSVSPIQTGWVGGFLLITVAALRPSPPRTRNFSARQEMLFRAVPAAPATAGIVVTLAAWIADGHLLYPLVSVAIMSLLVILGLAHGSIAALEVDRLTSDLERKVAERTRELHRTERYFRALVQHSSDVVMVVDPEMRIRYASESAWNILGHSPEQLIGRDLSVFGQQAADSLSDAIGRTVFNPEEVARSEWTLIDPSGQLRSAESTITNMLSDPHIEGFVLNTRDDTARVALESELRIQAFHDPLTGLPNRTLLGDRAEQAFARAQRNGTSLGLIALDVDAFKLVNDGFGHKVGDQLLCEVAARLSSQVRAQDTVARLGGDEFVVLLDSLDSTQAAVDLAERLRACLHSEIVIDGQAHHITASLGVAVGNAPHTNFDQLLSDADVALYAVKEAGKDAVQLFKANLNQDISSRVKLQSELRKAIEEEELCLLFQPEFHADDGRLQGFEALLRWQHPERGLLSPDTFIPLAEESGLVIPIGRWVLRESLKHAAGWRDEDGEALPVVMSVNVSAVQLKAPSLISDVTNAINLSGIDSSRVVLEVTESSFVEYSDAVIETLHALKDLGVKLAIDDFGTGYASVANLQRMPIDIIKIDRSFIAAIADDEHGTDLLEAIVGIGRALALVTIAEGIEDARQLATARSLGCDVVQGYLLGRPEPLDSAERMIIKHLPALREAALRVSGPVKWPTLEEPAARRSR